MATKNLGRVVGKSAYEIWLEQGNTGTEEAFLNSLKGKDGANGTDGKNGADGTNGQDGYSPTATVTQTDTGATITITDKNGTTTTNITNGKDGTNGTNGTDGKDGAKGADGVSVTHSWNGTTLTVTSASGTSSADLKGEKGDTGDTGATGSNGVDGKTPVKGTDYWTEEDKEEIVTDVIARLEETPAKEITIESKAGGYWNGTTDEWHDSSSLCVKRTNLIPTTEGEKFKYTGKAAFDMRHYAFYDESMNYISSYKEDDTGDTKTLIVEIPAGVSYVRFYSYAYTTDPDNVILEVTFMATEEEEENPNPLYGKKIVYDGDSICIGTYGGGGYAKIIADKVGGVFVNQAVGGARLTASTEDSTYHSVVDNLVNLPTDGDLYCLEGGVNDVWGSVSLGTYDELDYTGEVDTSTICGALETIFRYCINNFIGKPICFVIVHKVDNINLTNFKNYHDSVVGICKKYSIPYYDAYSESGLNGWNEVQDHYFLTGNSSNQPDGCHPNEEGYKRYYVPQLISLFEKIMPENIEVILAGWNDVELTWIENAYVTCSAIGSAPKTYDASGFSYASIPVTAGEKYKIKNRHNYNANSWFTTNSDGKCVREDSASDSSATIVEEEITIQEDETKLYVGGDSEFAYLKKWY